MEPMLSITDLIRVFNDASIKSIEVEDSPLPGKETSHIQMELNGHYVNVSVHEDRVFVHIALGEKREVRYHYDGEDKRNLILNAINASAASPEKVLEALYSSLDENSAKEHAEAKVKEILTNVKLGKEVLQSPEFKELVNEFGSTVEEITSTSAPLLKRVSNALKSMFK